ncbi:MAG: sugar phosphate isomerase/epimerase family protein [Lachnospiraceae bacterium]
MKLSVFYDHILQASEQSGKSILTLCREVKSAGIDGVEIRLGNLLGDDYTFECLGDAKLDISCIYDFYDMSVRDEMKHGENHINAACIAGAEKILVVPGFFSKDDKSMTCQNNNTGNPAQKDGHTENKTAMFHKLKGDYGALCSFLDNSPDVQAMVNGLNYMTEYAKDKDITVTVEDFDDVNSPLSVMNGVRYFVEHVPGLMHTLDCGNYYYSHENILEAWKLLKDKVAHVHCKDRADVSVAVGDGCIPFGDIVTNLKLAGYDGYLAIEHFDAPGQRIAMRRSAEYLKKLWGTGL